MYYGVKKTQLEIFSLTTTITYFYLESKHKIPTVRNLIRTIVKIISVKLICKIESKIIIASYCTHFL